MVPATFAGELDMVPGSAESSVLEQGSPCSQQGWKAGSVCTGPSPGAACPHLQSAFLGMLPLRQLASLGARGWGGGDWKGMSGMRVSGGVCFFRPSLLPRLPVVTASL